MDMQIKKNIYRCIYIYIYVHMLRILYTTMCVCFFQHARLQPRTQAFPSVSDFQLSAGRGWWVCLEKSWQHGPHGLHQNWVGTPKSEHRSFKVTIALACPCGYVVYIYIYMSHVTDIHWCLPRRHKTYLFLLASNLPISWPDVELQTGPGSWRLLSFKGNPYNQRGPLTIKQTSKWSQNWRPKRRKCWTHLPVNEWFWVPYLFMPMLVSWTAISLTCVLIKSRYLIIWLSKSVKPICFVESSLILFRNVGHLLLK